MNEQRVCGFCHAGEDGMYSMFSFEHPTDPQCKAMVSFCDGMMVIEIDRSSEENVQRLSSTINYCPICGRRFEEDEHND